MPSIADPALRNAGQSAVPGYAPPARQQADPGRGPGRSMLTDLFPTFSVVTCGFEQLTIPAAPGINAGESGWYGLAELRVGADIDQDCYLDWISVEVCPTESAAAGGNAQWGTTSGTGAAIVVGQDLPMVLDAWSSAACYVPGVESAAAGNMIAAGVSPYAAWFTFPTGEYSDTAPNKPYKPMPMGKVATRFREGSRFCVALVVRGSQITAGANKTLRGHVAVYVRLGRTQTTQGFNL